MSSEPDSNRHPLLEGCLGLWDAMTCKMLMLRRKHDAMLVQLLFLIKNALERNGIKRLGLENADSFK